MLYLELTIMFYVEFYTALCMSVIDPVPQIKLNLTETIVDTQSEEMQQKAVTELEKFCICSYSNGGSAVSICTVSRPQINTPCSYS